MKLIIQIPCYNEEETLGVTVADLPKEIEGIETIEYLIINDGSKDDTVAVARELGIHHIVSFRRNKGLAKGFMAGLDACLHLGADIIVNTDADNQYEGADIKNLVRPILEEKASIVIGERPIADTAHFSPLKKRLQNAGSWVVRVASGTDVPDAPSGFRAYSREAAMRMNVTNAYTYTLETIIQAGMNRIATDSVPIRTNPETRESRLFSSMFGYVKRSASVILRSSVMYRPLRFFFILSAIFGVLGLGLGVRYLVLYFTGSGDGHVQSLILTAILIFLSAQTAITGVLSDMIAVNRKLIEDVQYHTRSMHYDGVRENKRDVKDEFFE